MVISRNRKSTTKNQPLEISADTLHEKCPYLEFFWLAFSSIRTEYQEILVSLRIQSECRKIRTRKTPNTDNVHRVDKQKQQFKRFSEHFMILKKRNLLSDKSLCKSSASSSLEAT